MDAGILMAGSVLVSDDAGVRVVTLNRPHARNAVDRALAEGLAEALTELDNRDDLRVGVIHGAGTSFCAGMDLKAFPTEGIPKVIGRGFAGIVEHAADKPVIAAVEGYALAGGFEIALACDLIVAGRSARFGLPEVTRGLVAAAGGLLRLPSRLPYHLAMSLALTGEMLDASTANAHGLVTVVADDGGALESALRLARVIASNAPLAVQASKYVVSHAADWPADEAFARQAEVTDLIFESEDAKEGAQAFAQRRSPRWTAR
jgi:enoyl-CoA hydratase